MIATNKNTGSWKELLPVQASARSFVRPERAQNTIFLLPKGQARDLTRFRSTSEQPQREMLVTSHLCSGFALKQP